MFEKEAILTQNNLLTQFKKFISKLKKAKDLAVGFSDAPMTTWSLYRELLAFNEEQQRLAKLGPSQHDHPITEEDIIAYDLHRRKNQLTQREQENQQQLLLQLELRFQEKWNTIFTVSSACFHWILATQKENSDLSRESLRKAVFSYLETIPPLDDETMKYQIEELVTSKILIQQIENTVNNKQHIAYLVAAHKEGNRLQRKKDCFTGEDFLRNKVMQLAFLYENCTSLSWSLIFVDDEAKTLANKDCRSIDLMRRLVSNDPFLQFCKDQIYFLDYEQDLMPEIQAYQDDTIRKMDADTFARTSVKGGAIQTGLRYIARACQRPVTDYKTPIVDTIIWTDCDLSVNLAGTGILLYPIYFPNSDQISLSVGSRLNTDSHVIGKPEHRHIQSFIFNNLVKHLLNVDISDTLVGAKAITTAAVLQIHQGFYERSMAFDAEIYKLLSLKQLNLKESGIVWIDSEIESQSEGLGPDIFLGLMRIVKKFYPTFEQGLLSTISNQKQNLWQLSTELLKPEFRMQMDAVLALATDQKWNFIINHAELMYQNLLPEAFKGIVDDSKRLLAAISSEGNFLHVLSDLMLNIKAIATDTSPQVNFQFFLHLFPQINLIIELILLKPQSIQIIVPLLFGNNVFTNPINSQPYMRFSEFITKYPERNQNRDLREAFQIWIKEGFKPEIQPAQPRQELSEPQRQLTEQRISHGIVRLNRFDLMPIKVGICMLYNSPDTPKSYFDACLKAKIERLASKFGHFTHLTWSIYLVNAIPENKRNEQKENEIVLYLQKLNQINQNIVIKLLQAPANSQKAAAVRFGMSYAAREDNCSFVGFIDFSDKIDIAEMSHLLAYLLEEKSQNKEAVAIGSRRMSESAILNKPLIMVLRSMWLNILVKSMFPLLAQLSDTQTGFKLLSQEAWLAIAKTNLECNSLSFDVELLQQAARLGLNIKEFAVDFIDNKQNTAPPVDAEDVQDMFSEIIQIRARLPDLSLKDPAPNEARFLAAGAEHMVYHFNGTLIKVPHEVISPEFMGVLKYIIFKNRPEMSLNQQHDRLLENNILQVILNHPKIKVFIPQLRSWQNLNAFVMRVIAAAEKKNYKSMGYYLAAAKGKDLIIPFRFVQETFSCKIDNKTYTFSADDEIKQSFYATETFRSRFNRIVHSGNPNCEEQLQSLIETGVQLFYRLWSRGIFDLDMNLLCDTGFYPSSKNQQELLMSLDPGEIISDLTTIDVEFHRAQITKRYDYLEFSLILEQSTISLEIREKILHFYIEKMNHFFDLVANDCKAFNESLFEVMTFGQDYKNDEENKDFSIQVQTAPLLLEESKKPSHYSVPYAHISALRQQPYRFFNVDKKENEKLVGGMQTTNHYFHFIPLGREIIASKETGEIRICSEAGSILPTLSALKPYLNNPSFHNISIVLNAGSATRTSLLKATSPGSTKGEIILEGKPLYQHAAQSIKLIEQSLATAYPQEKFIIMAASDEIFNFNSQDMDSLIQYFSKVNSPAFFWFDLPNAGKNIFPLTLEENVNLLKENQQFFQDFLYEIPFLMGHQELASQIIKTLLLMLEYEIKSQKEGKNELQNKVESQNANIISPHIGYLVSCLSSYYRAWALAQGHRMLGGTKTPFLLIFKQDFLQDFQTRIIDSQLLPSYVATDITWESILVQAIKSDLTLWKASIPAIMNNAIGLKKWIKIWEIIQELKTKYHINNDDREQNDLRIYKGNWGNFDDPLALFQYMVEKHALKTNALIINDNQLEPFNFIHKSHETVSDVKVVMVNSGLKDNLVLQFITAKNKKPPRQNYCMLYNVSPDHLNNFSTLEIRNNDLIIGGYDHKLYAIDMGPFSKEELKKEPVFTYDSKGQRIPTHKNYAQFMEEIAIVSPIFKQKTY